MTTGGFRVTALRVKLPCEDEKDFYARLADTIAEKGLRVPTANLRPIGTRVRVILEFRDARTLSGEGIVDAHVEGPRPTMNVRLVKFERSRPGAGAVPAATRVPRPAPTPTPGETAPPTPPPTAAPKRAATPVAKLAVASPAAPTPVPAAKAATPTPAPATRPVPAAGAPVREPTAVPPAHAEPAEAMTSPDPERVAAASGAAAAPSSPAAAPETSFASLMDDAIEEGARPPGPAPRPPAEGTEQLEPLYGASAAPEPTPSPQPAAPPTGGALPAASRRAALAAVAAAAVLALALLAYAIARRPASPPPDPAAVAAAAAADVEAQLVSRVASADRRISEGRLTGPDGALDHLLAAKALKADDARVKDRLRLLADTLEMLGGRALERGDASEAEVHLSAALQAEPGRQSISDKLQAVRRIPVAPDARSRPGTAEKAP